MKNRTEPEHRRERTAVILLLALGFALRLLAIGALPFGLNQDEASAGYETLALLREGIDRCGKPWPVLLVSWGSGQNVLMTYLAMPFVALLGLSELSIRLPNALLGCLTLPVFWLLARRCGGRRFGLLALGLLTVNPWHVMMSRWGLESNLLPFFLLTGVWLTSVSMERPWALTGAAAAFGLSLYAYGTAFFFLPLYLLWAVIVLRKRLKPAPFLTALGIFLILALPIGVCQLRNALHLEELTLLGLTLPRLTENRQAATSIFGGGGSDRALENFRGFLRILWRGGDGLPYNALPFWKGGIFYFFGLPTAAIGAVGSLFLRKDRREEGPVRIALACGLVCAFFIDGNINRLNLLWLPLIYCSALGCYLLLEKRRLWVKLASLAVAAACFLLFLFSYCADFGGAGYSGYFPGLGAAIRAAESYAPDTVYITDWVNQPYIFALFYTEASPSEFAATVEYQNADAPFRRVLRCSGFEFEDPAKADILILHRYETGDREVLAESGSFAVCKGAP